MTVSVPDKWDISQALAVQELAADTVRLLKQDLDLQPSRKLEWVITPKSWTQRPEGQIENIAYAIVPHPSFPCDKISIPESWANDLSSNNIRLWLQQIFLHELFHVMQGQAPWGFDLPQIEKYPFDWIEAPGTYLMNKPWAEPALKYEFEPGHRYSINLFNEVIDRFGYEHTMRFWSETKSAPDYHSAVSSYFGLNLKDMAAWLRNDCQA